VSRFWTCYWRYAHWRSNPESVPLRRSGGSQFKSRRVSESDVVYVVSVHKGRLFLGGKMTVDRITTRAEAVRIAGSSLFDVDEWIEAKQGSGTPMNHRRRLAPKVVEQFEFISANPKARKPRFSKPGELDRQTFRCVRELTPETARKLDRIIGLTDREASSRHGGTPREL
jgi:hypothetical protein